jgi:HlyD family secretion protein
VPPSELPDHPNSIDEVKTMSMQTVYDKLFSTLRVSPRPATPSVIAAVCAALALIAVGTSVVVRASDPKAITEKPALTVTTVLPQSAQIAQLFSASGNIVAWQEAIIGAEVNGLRISEIRANIGDTVRKGQTLATFAPETVEAELAQSKASVAEAEASLAEAQANAERAKSLEASGALSAQQIQQYTTAAKTAEARLAAAKAVARVQQVRLAQTQLVAPDDGVVSGRTATVGAVVQAGQELFRMVRRNRLEWRAEVTSAELGKVSIGQAVSVLTPAGESVRGKVRMIAPTIDPTTRNVQVFVDLEPSKAAKAGMFARGNFALGTTAGLTIPQQALVVRDGFSYVFVIEGETNPAGALPRVKQLKVESGRRVGDRIEVRAGLDANTAVVASGAGFLKDGDAVRVVAAPTAPAAPAIPAAPKKS